MKGFIIKDLLMMKGNIKIVGIIFLLFIFMAFSKEGDLSFLPAFLSIMLVFSTFSYDEYNKWNAYAITLPNGRKHLVQAKYIVTILLVVFFILFTSLLSIGIRWYQNDLDIEEILSIMVGCGCGVLFIISIMYPFIFKFGIEKARVGIFAMVFGVSILLGVLLKQVQFSIPSDFIFFLDQYFFIVIPIVLLGMLVISYYVSYQIYQKKEF